MKRYVPIAAWGMAAALTMSALAAPPRPPITPVEIAAAMNRAGIAIAPGQVELLSNVAAATPFPQLRVQSIQRVDARRMMARLACEKAGECLPFFVRLQLLSDAEARTIAQWKSPDAVPPPSPVSFQAPKVRAGMPAVLIIEGDHVHIRLTVICLQNGAMGQTVRAADRNRDAFYTAKVAGNGLLRGRL